MTLLAPLAGLIGLALAGPVLVAFYLLKLRRRPVMVSSTMFWDEAVRDMQVNVPWRFIPPTLLFFLHALLLAVLLLALSRPAIESSVPDADRVFVLIDNSASMRARDPGLDGTRLDRAKNSAADLLRDLGGRSGWTGWFTGATATPEVTVIAYAAEPAIVAGPSDRPDTLVPAIEFIEPTDQAGNLAAALELVRRIASSGPASDDTEITATATAVLVSDGGDAPDPAAIARAAGPLGLSFRRVGPGETTPKNLGITSLAVARDPAEPSLVRVFCRVLATDNAPAQVTATLAIDGEVIQRATVPAGSSEPAPSVFSFDRTDGGVVTLALPGNDALAADDQASAVLEPARGSLILLIAQPDSEGNPAPDPALADVLGFLPTRGVQPITPSQLARLDDEVVTRFDAAVVDRVSPGRPLPMPALLFGALPDGAPTFGERDPVTPVLAWQRNHPALRDAPLGTLRVGRRLALPEPGADNTPADLSVLARGEAGPLIIAWRGAWNAPTPGEGPERIAVGFPISQSNWTLDIAFPIFVAASLEHLTSSAPDASRAFTTADVALAPLPVGRTIEIDGPSAPLAAGRTSRPGPAGLAAIGVLPRAGVHIARTGESSAVIAVNLASAAETGLRSPDALGLPSASNAASPAASAATVPRRVRELWPELIALAVILLAVEWAAYAWRMRG